MKRKSVVITGCSGFIGSQVTLDFLRDGWRVLGIDKETYVSNDIFELIEDCEREGFYAGHDLWNIAKNFTYWKKDICDLDRLPDCEVFCYTQRS
jgi:nucleoside-diphosphate-sugar epimerase